MNTMIYDNLPHYIGYFMNETEIAMYYHTTIRNVALFLSITVAIIEYARYYKIIRPSYYILLLIFGIMFLVVSIGINYFLIENISSFLEKNPKSYIKRWKYFNYILLLIQALLLLMTFWILFSSASKLL